MSIRKKIFGDCWWKLTPEVQNIVQASGFGIPPTYIRNFCLIVMALGTTITMIPFQGSIVGLGFVLMGAMFLAGYLVCGVGEFKRPIEGRIK